MQSSPPDSRSVPPSVAVTVVVVANTGRNSEPYLGRPPVGDACYVFGQHPLESPFVLDLRLRDRLSALVDAGHRIASAVLVWDHLQPDLAVLRRAKLVARRVGAGGKIFLAAKDRAAVPNPRFDAFARELERELSWLGVELVVAAGADAEPEAAPLTAAWNRLQRLRLGGAVTGEFENSEEPTQQLTESEAPASHELRRSAVFARKRHDEPALARQVRRANGA